MAATHTNATFCKLDIDELEDIADTYDVSSLPTFMVFVDGVEKTKIVGSKLEKITECLDSLASSQQMKCESSSAGEAQMNPTSNPSNIQAESALSQAPVNQDPLVYVCSKQRFTLVYFYTQWFAPCQKFAPEFDTLSTLFPNVSFLKVDADAYFELTSRYSTRAPPFVILFHYDKPIQTLTADLNVIKERLSSLNDSDHPQNVVTKHDVEQPDSVSSLEVDLISKDNFTKSISETPVKVLVFYLPEKLQ